MIKRVNAALRNTAVVSPLLIGCLSQGQQRANKGPTQGQHTVTGRIPCPQSVLVPPTANLRFANTHQQPLLQDGAASDSLEPMLQLGKSNRFQRRGARLILRVELDIGAENFNFNPYKAAQSRNSLPCMRVRERYPWSGELQGHRRQDMRRGARRGARRAAGQLV